MEELSSTQKMFQEIGKKEFLEHGYKGASLRKIVSSAGFTLGAFYGYYHSKEELFQALVQEEAEYIRSYIQRIYDRVKKYPQEERIFHITESFADELSEAVDYFILHQEELKLLLCRAEGTVYENFLDTMMGITADNIGEETIRLTGQDTVFQLLIQAYYSMLVKVVLSGRDKDTIMKTMLDIQYFYQYGFQYFIREDKES